MGKRNLKTHRGPCPRSKHTMCANSNPFRRSGMFDMQLREKVIQNRTQTMVRRCCFCPGHGHVRPYTERTAPGCPNRLRWEFSTINHTFTYRGMRQHIKSVERQKCAGRNPRGFDILPRPSRRTKPPYSALYLITHSSAMGTPGRTPNLEVYNEEISASAEMTKMRKKRTHFTGTL